MWRGAESFLENLNIDYLNFKTDYQIENTPLPREFSRARYQNYIFEPVGSLKEESRVVALAPRSEYIKEIGLGLELELVNIRPSCCSKFSSRKKSSAVLTKWSSRRKLNLNLSIVATLSRLELCAIASC